MLPLPPRQKLPPPHGYTGRDGKIPSRADIQAWLLDEPPNSNIALRLPETVVGLDIDAYNGKPGAETLAALEEQHGPLPPTISSTSRGRGLSGIYFFQVSPGQAWHDLPGIEIVAYGLRYAVVWPSKHPRGPVYRWYDSEGNVITGVPSFDDLAVLPESYVRAFSNGVAGDGPSKVQAGADQIREWWAQTTKGEPCQRVASDRDEAIAALESRGGESRHGIARTHSMKLVGSAAAGHPGTVDALNEVKAAFLTAVTRPGDAQRTEREAQTEWANLIRGATKKVMVDHPSPSQVDDPCRHVAANVSAESPRISEEVWDARPELDHIRRAANSRGPSPDAVLATALARVAASAPHTVKLPPTVGSTAGLSLICALVGKPGTGKSSTAAIAQGVLLRGENLKPECDGVPLGTGEGLVELLFGTMSEIDRDTNKPVKVKKQMYYNAYLYVDEGENMLNLRTNKTGRSLSPTLRTIFSDGTLGNTNASQETRRYVPAGQYVYGVVLGFQPDIIGPLFGEEGAGTPQRLFFASSTVPAPAPGERPAHPGPLNYPRIPPLARSGHEHTVVGDFNTHMMTLPDQIKREVEVRDHKKQTAGTTPFDEHQDLIRLKVAGILAVLQGRLAIVGEDWQLAGSLCETSRNVRDQILGEIRSKRRDLDRDATERAAGRAVATSEATYMASVVDTAQVLTSKVKADPGALTRGSLKSALSKSRRRVYEDALDHALASGWVHEEREPGQGSEKVRLFPGLKKNGGTE